MEPTGVEHAEIAKLPLTMRFHHIAQLEYLNDHSVFYQRDRTPRVPGRGIRIVGFRDLWQHPELVDGIIDSYVPHYLNGLNPQSTNEEDSEYAKDFIGESGELRERFLAADRAVLKRIINAKPEERFSLTWGPDLMCHACPRNGPDKPGNHCILPDTMNEDVKYYKDIESLRMKKTTPQEIREDIKEKFDAEGRHTFELSADTLRSDDFYNRATVSMFSDW